MVGTPIRLELIPPHGPVAYPWAFDVASSALRVAPTPLLRTVAGALAPTFEQLAAYGLVDGAGPSWDDVADQETDHRERLLLGALAAAVARSGISEVAIARPRFLGPSGLTLLRLLAVEAQERGVDVCVTLEPADAKDATVQESIRGVRVIEVSSPRALRVEEPAASLLAACPQGFPASLAPGAMASAGDALAVSDGPAGERHVHVRVGAQVERRGGPVASHLLEAWSRWRPDGWGYVRRAPLLFPVSALGPLRAQHRACVEALATFGRDALCRQFRAMVRALDAEPASRARPEELVHALVGAARLEPRSDHQGGFVEAAPLYERAFLLCQDPATRLAIGYEWANLFAVTKKPDALKTARGIYATLRPLLPTVADEGDRRRMTIRVLNGLALVEYHEGRDAAALALEHEARSIASECDPETRAWALGLLNANTAKLLERRFKDRHGAEALLAQNVALEEAAGAAEGARIDLARLRFDEGNDERVIELLADLCDPSRPVADDLERELFARVMYSVSLYRSNRGDRGASQQARIRWLARSLETPRAERLLSLMGGPP